MPEKIKLELSRKEALVLFEYLRRSDDDDNYAFADQAEQRVLWDLECALQPQFLEIFDPNYNQIISEAWAALRDAECNCNWTGSIFEPFKHRFLSTIVISGSEHAATKILERLRSRE